MNKQNLGEYLRKWALSDPDKPALLYPSSISYRELDQKVDQLAHGLDRMGLKKGMKAIMLVPVNKDFFILTFALLRMGVILVLIDPGVGRKVMKKSLSNVNADAFIGMPLAHIFRLLNYKAFQNIRFLLTLGPRFFWKGRSYKSFFAKPDVRFNPPKTDPNDIGGIFFTSGSTGSPKGVIYQNRMFHAQIHYFSTHYKWSEKEIDLCTFPLIGLFSICLGSSVVIADMNPSKPASLSPEKIWNNIEEHHCTHMFASPMILRKLSAYAISQGKNLSSMKRIVSAGAPVPVDLLQKMKSILPSTAEIHTPYGATEALPVTDISATDLINLDQELEFIEGICVGRPLDRMTIKIIEISDKPISNWSEVIELATGEIGEITVSGPVVTEAYLNNPEADSKSKISVSESIIFHRMGDLGRIDKFGRLWFYGRKNHRVQIHGQTLYTIPTEAIFNQHPLVRRSALVGVKQKANNETVPIIIIEPESSYIPKLKKSLIRELQILASENQLTDTIHHYLLKKEFPVDPRHNAKIFREKLSQWAQKKIQ